MKDHFPYLPTPEQARPVALERHTTWDKLTAFGAAIVLTFPFLDHLLKHQGERGKQGEKNPGSR